MSRKCKQVIIIRKDLNMRKGKMISAGAHASLSAVLNYGSKITDNDDIIRIPLTKNTLPEGFLNEPTVLKEWLLDGLSTKITVYVNSEAELVELYDKAKDMGLICSMITDVGLTEFNGVPTKTCVAIGPAWSDEIDEITNKLPLL